MRIKIDLYQTDDEPGAMRTVYEKVLTPSPLNSGETHKWDFRTGDIVAVVVPYTRKSNPLSWLLAESSIWMSEERTGAAAAISACPGWNGRNRKR